MPISPPPREYSCPACGWSKTATPRSDVVIPGDDFFESCPKCGHQSLDVNVPSQLQMMISNMANIIRQAVKR